MPAESDHVAQARRNARFLAGIDLQPPAQCCDWAVTVAFYTALHLVEAEFARRNRHCTSHPKRNSEVSLHLGAIESDYLLLYMASRRARYNCVQITPEAARQVLQDNYDPVRVHVCNLLGVQL
jgi:hypothetical protein